MYDKEVEPFSNPLAPPSAQVNEKRDSIQRQDSSQEHFPLTNDDFRKLMQTPRVSLSSQSQNNSSVTASVRSSDTTRGSRPKSVLKQELNENRKKKKKFYATLKKQEDDTLSELAKRYRDRARERRDGANPDYHQESESSMATTAAYRAVAPDVKSGLDAAERRKQVIQESKFLGGDMEHTHLVKGLDYALLQKVKAEIVVKSKDDKDNKDDDDEELLLNDEENASHRDSANVLSDIPLEADDPFAIKSKFAKNLVNVLFNRQIPERNELFIAGRMAYVVELEDDFAESDIPTTVIRSKSDCPNIESMATLSTNDIVINKLTQILSYLRHGGSSKKTKKPKEKIPLIGENDSLKRNDKNNGKPSKTSKTEDSIYEDIEDYVPDLKRKDSKSERERDRDKNRAEHRDHNNRDHRDRDRNRDKRSRNYFDKQSHEEEHELRRNERDAKLIAISGITGGGTLSTGIQLRNKLPKSLDQEMPESYAECYPGAPENDDAILDSDDEVDYSKMDLGNKKGLIGRWDFDTAEEYGDYMSHKEALPKAAFQYGVKMADGRKTRRVQGKKDEKAKLDRDLQKINAIIAKRKAEGSDGSLSFNVPSIEHKKHKTH